MMHDKRVWCVSEVASPEELAEKLTSTTWCCCTAFKIARQPRYAWLNDSTSPDGAQEYAVCQLVESSGNVRQLESITFGWSDNEQALKYILATLNGEDDSNEWAHNVAAVIQSSEQHGRCGHCA